MGIGRTLVSWTWPRRFLALGSSSKSFGILICRKIGCWCFKYNAMVHELAAIRVATIDQVKTQQVTNAALYDTNQLLARLVCAPPVR